MSVTNAVSGMTAIGGLELMRGGLLPDTWMAAVAALSVLLSAINVAGGFVMTGACTALRDGPQPSAPAAPQPRGIA